MFRTTLLLLLGSLCACESHHALALESPYDVTIVQYTKHLKRKNPKTKHVKGLETAFQRAQAYDLSLIDSLSALHNPADWPAINTLHRHIQSRQNKVTALPALQSKDGYTPDLHWIADIDQLEAESRRQAATFLYTQARANLADCVATGNRPAARLAYYTILDLKHNYYLYWEHANELLDSARLLGVTHILLENNPAIDTSASREFWRNVVSAAPRLHSEWQAYYVEPTALQSYDYVATCRLESIWIGSESRSESTRTEEKDVEKGFEEIKDTSGRVIERKPIYEHVQAEIKEVKLQKDSQAQLLLELRHVRTGEIVRSEHLTTEHNYAETFNYVSGDSRALSSIIIPSANAFPTVPMD